MLDRAPVATVYRVVAEKIDRARDMPFAAPRQTDGRRWILLTKDAPDTLREVVRGELSPIAWLRSLSGTRVDGVFDVRDPLPGLTASWRLAKLVGARRRARKRAQAAPPDAAPPEIEL